MTDAPDPTFADALARGEVDRFLAGDPPWFVVSRSDDDEPQNVPAAFNACIVAEWKRAHDPAIPVALVDGLIRLLQRHPDKNRAIYAAADWVWHYLFHLALKRDRPDSRWGDLFELDLSGVGILLKTALERNRAALMADQRWAGETWNSQDGLWTPLMRTAIAVRDKLGGPDFVPDDTTSPGA